MNQLQRPPNRTINSPSSGPMALLTSLFFIWGFITCLNDILIPHLKAVFTLNYGQAMLIQFCFFTAYFVVSLPSGYLVERIGYKAGIIIGLTVAGIGCLLFYPSAEFRYYPLFLAALFVLASGIALLQVAANPYVTLLGNAETDSSRLTMTQAFNSLGTTLAPFFGSLFMLATPVKTADEIKHLTTESLSAYQATEAASVQQPYLFFASVLFAFAIVFTLIKLPGNNEINSEDIDHQHTETIYLNAWLSPHLVLGAIGIFLYVGAEVSIGSFLVSFLSEPAISGLTPNNAAQYVPFYWGGAMIGRFVGAAVMRTINPGKALVLNAMCAVLLVIATILGSGYAAMGTILLVGLFNSIMFPTIFSLALHGLGKHTGQGSGILCAAIVGGAILPVLQGMFADRYGVQQAFFVPALCYVYIAWFGWRSCRQQNFP